jgi:hypothetical protein
VKVDTKLKKLGAIAFIASLDHRQNGNKERMDRMLQLIADWVEDDMELQGALWHQVEVLAKRCGFKISFGKQQTHISSKETH